MHVIRAAMALYVFNGDTTLFVMDHMVVQKHPYPCM